MYTIRHLIIDFIFVFMVVFGLELQATTPYSSDLSSIISKEICMDELFQTSSHLNLSVLRTTYIDNGIEINYEVIITPLGEAYILKDNQTTVKSLSYSSGDFFSTKLKPGVLEIFKNSTLVYSQSVSNAATNKSSSAIIKDKLYLIVMDNIEGYCGGRTKCEVDGWDNARFVSKNVLKYEDEGFMSFDIVQLNKFQMIGFGNNVLPNGYSDLNYALYVYTDSRIRVFENGIRKMHGPRVSIGDQLTIKKTGNTIQYYLNDALLYRSIIPVTHDLYTVGTTYSQGTILPEITASFTDLNGTLPGVDIDFWETITGFCIQSSHLVKCGSNMWGNAKFISKSKFASSDDGDMSFNIAQIDKRQMIGLGSRTTAPNHYRDINYALYILDGRLKVYENGALNATASMVSVGDKLSIKKTGNTIEYFLNDALIYRSIIQANSDLYIMGTSYDQGSILPDISVIVDDGNSNVPEIDYDFWETITGFCDQESRLVKCVSEGWDNATYISKAKLMSTEDGDMSFNIVQMDDRQMIGLGGRSSAPSHYSDIEFALYIYSDKRVRVFENGTRKMLGPIVSAGEKLSIKKIGNQIKYYLNDAIIYTSSLQVNHDLYIMGTSYDQGSILPDISASFLDEGKLYTMSSIDIIPNKPKWNRIRGYGHDLEAIVSNSSELSFAITENYYRPDQEVEGIISPNLEVLFSPEIFDVECQVVIGVKNYLDGDYLNENISEDNLSLGLKFIRTKEGNQQVLVLEQGQVVKYLPEFTKESKYRIRLSNNEVFIEVLLGHTFRPFYSKVLNVDSSSKVLLYQGSEVNNSPFLDINIKGFTKGYFSNLSYLFEGKEDLLTAFNGDITKVINRTGQININHKISWGQFVNINDKNEHSISNGLLEQADRTSMGQAESIMNFSNRDKVVIESEYLGGDYNLGVKPILNTLNQISAGYSINSGIIKITNKISGGSSPIKSGDKISMILNGNSTMTIALNGHSIGVAQMPQSLLNLNLQILSGSINTFYAYSNNNMYIPYYSANIGLKRVVQSEFRSDCQGHVMSQIRIDNNGPSTSPPILIKVLDINTNAIVYTSTMVINSQNTGVQSLNLPIGIYQLNTYYNNSFHEEIFEVTTPIKWNENNSFASQVEFDDILYNNNNAQSILKLLSPNGNSFTKAFNSIPAGQDGTFILPIGSTTLGKYLFDIMSISNLFISNTSSMKLFGETPPPGSVGFAHMLNANVLGIKIRVNRISSSQVQLTIVQIHPFGNESTIQIWNVNWPDTSPITLNVKSKTNNANPFVLVQSLSTDCPEPPPVALDLDAEVFGFGIMKRQYDNNYFVAKDGELRFEFEEEYFVSSMQLNYKLYDMYSTDITSQCSSVFPVNMGENRYFLNLDTDCSSFTSNQYYRLEVYNSKGERRVLRFLYPN